MSFVLNKKAIHDFLHLGYIKPNDTFFSTSGPEDYKPLKFVEAEVKNIEEHLSLIYSSLEQAIDKIIESRCCSSFAISGGVDSRLILHFLIKNHRTFLDNSFIYTRYHPDLGLNQDRDCLIVQLLQKKFDLKINYESATGYASSYLKLNDEKHKLVLTGLWGGELLGGQVINNVLFSYKEFMEQQNQSDLVAWILDKNKDILNYSEYKKMEFQLHVQLLMSSSFTAFYRARTWLNPMMPLKVCRTPFLNEDFLRLVKQSPWEWLQNYKLYRLLFTKYLGKIASLPFSNVVFAEQQAPALGKDPKQERQKLNSKNIFKSDEASLLKDSIVGFEGAKYYQYLKSLLD